MVEEDGFMFGGCRVKAPLNKEHVDLIAAYVGVINAWVKFCTPSAKPEFIESARRSIQTAAEGIIDICEEAQ